MRKRVLLIILFVFFFVFYGFRSAVIQDPDFGWHLQFGRMVIRTHTIPIQDTYSYTMPSYHFINHEWGTGVIFASIYDRLGIWALIIIFALISICALYILTFGTDTRWAIMPIFLIGGTLVDFTRISPQVFTWVFSSVVISLLWQEKVWQKWRFFVPFIFLLWANLHGGFAIGIFIVAWFVIGNMIENRSFDIKNSFVLFLSILATFCNPYGYQLWVEVWQTLTSRDLHLVIQEWYPSIYFDNLAFWLYMTVSLFLVSRYYKYFSIKILGLYAFLFLLAMSSMRNIPIFLVVSFYPTLLAVKYFYEEAGAYKYGKERFLRGYTIFFIITLCFYLPQLGIFTYDVMLYNPKAYYPEKAVSYLKNHLPQGNIFSSFGWGGYLIWQLPEKKVFIDGRMPTWYNPQALFNESIYAFGDYQLVLENKLPFSTISKKYNIDTLLISPNDEQTERQMILGIDVEKIVWLRNIIRPTMSFSPVVAQVKKMGWREVYHDQTAIVFEK